MAITRLGASSAPISSRRTSSNLAGPPPTISTSRTSPSTAADASWASNTGRRSLAASAVTITESMAATGPAAAIAVNEVLVVSRGFVGKQGLEKDLAPVEEAAGHLEVLRVFVLDALEALRRRLVDPGVWVRQD